MSKSPPGEDLAQGTQQSAIALGFWTALLLALVAAAAFALGITTPPRSGPYCTGTCIAYPFTDAAQFVPRDYRWVIPGILLIPIFVVVVACVHSLVEIGRRHLSVAGLCFASMAAGIIGIDYFIQFQMAEPSLVHGETAGLALFSMYNPHGVYIALEDLGFLTLCVAFLFVGLAVPRVTRLAVAIRWTLVAAALLGFATFAGMTWHFGLDLEYRFEVAVITITWITLLAAGVMLAFFFHDAVRQAPRPQKVPELASARNL